MVFNSKPILLCHLVDTEHSTSIPIRLSKKRIRDINRKLFKLESSDQKKIGRGSDPLEPKGSDPVLTLSPLRVLLCYYVLEVFKSIYNPENFWKMFLAVVVYLYF